MKPGVLSSEAGCSTSKDTRPTDDTNLLTAHRGEPLKREPGRFSIRSTAASVPNGITQGAFHFKMMNSTMNGHSENGSSNGIGGPPVEGKDELYETFAGHRDVRTTGKHGKIYGLNGTIRGYKNRVRAGIETFQKNGEHTKDYTKVEEGLLVVYITSTTVIREVFDRCLRVKKILQIHRVQFIERDIAMSKDHKLELKERLRNTDVDVPVPQIFANGVHIGGADEIECMNESGELKKLVKLFQKTATLDNCAKCGGYQFVPCAVCHGSKKSAKRNVFAGLRCTSCDESGLIKCDLCHVL